MAVADDPEAGALCHLAGEGQGNALPDLGGLGKDALEAYKKAVQYLDKPAPDCYNQVRWEMWGQLG